MLESEVELHKTVTQNSAEIVHIMTTFFNKSFREITTFGFDLIKLKTVQSVLEESHITSLIHQINQLRTVQDKIQQELPSVCILEDFLELLGFMATLKIDRKISLPQPLKQPKSQFYDALAEQQLDVKSTVANSKTKGESDCKSSSGIYFNAENSPEIATTTTKGNSSHQ